MNILFDDLFLFCLATLFIQVQSREATTRAYLLVVFNCRHLRPVNYTHFHNDSIYLHPLPQMPMRTNRARKSHRSNA